MEARITAQQRRVRRRRRSVITGIGALAIVGSLTACKDNATEARLVGPRSQVIVAPATALGPSSIAFDLSLETNNTGASVRSVRSHIVRTRGALGAWRTTITSAGGDPFATLPGAARRLARVEVDEQGAMSGFRVDGTAIAASTATGPGSVGAVALQRLPAGLRARYPGAFQISPLAAPAAASPRFRWVDSYFKSHSDRRLDLAAMSKAIGLTRGDPDGIQHLDKTHGARSVDFATDTARGEVTGYTMSSGARVVASVANNYVDGPAGLSIRTQVRFERMPSDSAPGRTTTIKLSNITIDGQGVRP
jgi:hypothetical protein